MATVKTDEELLAEFDEEQLRLRATLEAEDLTDWDINAAVRRAELEEELAAIDDDDEDRPMTHVCYTCDKCHREITSDRAVLAIKTGSQRDFNDSDLCPGCAQALRSWLAEAPSGGDTAPMTGPDGRADDL